MKPCDCTLTLRFMAARGAPLAALMLSRGRLESDADGAEQIAHFAEEKRYFFPYLPRPVAELLESQHVTFTREIRQHGRIVSIVLFQKHARMENEWAKKLMRAA